MFPTSFACAYCIRHQETILDGSSFSLHAFSEAFVPCIARDGIRGPAEVKGQAAVIQEPRRLSPFTESGATPNSGRTVPECQRIFPVSPDLRRWGHAIVCFFGLLWLLIVSPFDLHLHKFQATNNGSGVYSHIRCHLFMLQ